MERVDFPSSLREAVVQGYALRIKSTTQVVGLGDECDLWRIETDAGRYALRLSPSWRSASELAWCHRLLASLKFAVREVVAPIRATSGDTITVWEGRPFSLYPWVDGDQVSRQDASLRAAAAELLARVHRAMLAWPDKTERPGNPNPNPSSRTDLGDAKLDNLLSNAIASRRLMRGPIHGDYYPRNLLCKGGRIVGLLDWDDAHREVLIQELAWAIWEFAHEPDDVRLDLDHARTFLDAYMRAGGPVPDDEHALIIPFIRRRLRAEVRHALDEHVRDDGSFEDDYTEREIVAFEKLADVQIDWRR